MTRSTFLLLAGAVSAFLVALAFLAPLPGAACDLVNAKISWAGTEPCIPQAGEYITIGSAIQQDSVTECNLNGTYTRYTFSLRASCTGTPCTYPQFLVWGSNLSGTYKVSTLDGNCAELCACP